ncbi:MAG: hypothetical protein QOI03_783 [Solirubrobacteraceae bacterium]|nr:hypothetical protein [Solirubrobacteraceae bacterium]
MADEAASPNNVIVVSFEHDANAYDAMTKLKELDSQRQVDLGAAAIIVRHEDGQLEIKDEIAEDSVSGTASGGILGLLIGVLFGPFGVLIGGATGLLIGSLFDLDDDDDTESVLADISRYARAGHTTLLAEVSEPSPEVIDTAMSELGADVLRRPAGDVEAEIAAAEEAQKAAKRQARKVLREQRLAKHKANVHAKIEELKAKLGRHKSTAAAGA